MHYGIFYEEINHAGDGGLYAELIRNRSIEDNAANPDFWWPVGNARMSVTTGSIATGKTYHLKITVDNGFITTYIDGVKDLERSIMPNEQKLYLSSNIDDEQGKLYVKVTNPYGVSQPTVLRLAKGAFEGGRLHILTSPSGNDENTSGAPEFVRPANVDLEANGQEFAYTIPAYSLCIFEFDVTDAEAANEKVEVPEPLVRYSFETTKKRSDTLHDKSYAYTVSGSGTFVTEPDGNRCFATRSTGYIALGKAMPQAVLPQLKDEYTVSMRLKMDGIGNAEGFCWAWTLCGGTANYMALVNSPGNNNWYYEMTQASSGKRLDSRSGLEFGRWHTLVVTAKEGLTCFYIDGDLVSTTEALDCMPSEMAKSITTGYIGKSAFGGDKILSNCLFDDFCIYSIALDAHQVKAMHEGTSTLPTSIRSVTVTQPQTDWIYDLQGHVLPSASQSRIYIKKGKACLTDK